MSDDALLEKVLSLVFPDLRYGEDPDIERYFDMRRDKRMNDALAIYYGRLKPRYPDDARRIELLRLYRTHDPRYRDLMRTMLLEIATKIVAVLRDNIDRIASRIERLDFKNTYAVLKAVESLVDSLPQDPDEAVAFVERYESFASTLRYRYESVRKARLLVEDYLSASRAAVNEPYDFMAKSREREEAKRKEQERTSFFDLSKIAFSEEDVASIEIPATLESKEDKTLAFCFKYWNRVSDHGFERLVFLYSRKYKTFHYDIYRAIKVARGKKFTDDETLNSVSTILSSRYSYSVQGDLYMQRAWRRLKAGMYDASKQATPDGEGEKPRKLRAIKKVRSRDSLVVAAPVPKPDASGTIGGIPIKMAVRPANKKPFEAKAAADKSRYEKFDSAAAGKAAREKALAEKAAREKAHADNRAAERAAREKALAGKAARERAQADKRAADAAARDKALAEKAASDAARERALAEQASRDKALADKQAADKQARERALAEKAAREKAHADRLAADKAARERASAEKAAREAAARERARAEKAAREKARSDRYEREKLAREQAKNARLERELNARKRAEDERIARRKADKAREEAEAKEREAAAREALRETREAPPAQARVEAEPQAPRTGDSAKRKRSAMSSERAAAANGARLLGAATPDGAQAYGSVSDRIKKLSGRTYDVYRELFLSKVGDSIRKHLVAGQSRSHGIFDDAADKAEQVVYAFLKTNYDNPFMDWSSSEEKAKIEEMGFSLSTLEAVIDHCYSRL
jgi:hypothetical protein